MDDNINTSQSTSDYRGGQNYETDPNSQGKQYSQQQPRKSYVNATKTTPVQTFPKKDQAIIMGVVDNLKLCDYAFEVAELIGPKNLLFASRISNNRICMYLDSKETVDKLVEEHSTILVQDQEVNVRRMITPAKRLILSNVCPTIPNDIIQRELERSGLKLVSPVSFLKAAMPWNHLSHVCSFRRQVYISPPEDMHSIPASFVVSFEETTNRIFISTDEISCFACKRPGHIAKNCPTVAETAEDLSTHSQISPPSPISSIQMTGENQQTSTTTTPVPQAPVLNSPTKPKPGKRPLQSQSSTNTDLAEGEPSNGELESADATFAVPEAPPNIRRPKKLKQSKSAEFIPLDTELEAVKQDMDKDPSKYHLTFLNLKCFLENTRGNPDPLPEAKRYTTDIPGLVNLLGNIHPLIKDRALKSRITRLRKKLKTQLCSEDPEAEAQISSFSSRESLIDPDYDSQLDYSEDSSY